MSELDVPWLQIAKRPEILRRSLRVALIVGTILVLLNYTDRFLTGDLGRFDFIKMLLTYLVPFSVSTYASVIAIKEHGDS